MARLIRHLKRRNFGDLKMVCFSSKKNTCFTCGLLLKVKRKTRCTEQRFYAHPNKRPCRHASIKFKLWHSRFTIFKRIAIASLEADQMGIKEALEEQSVKISSVSILDLLKYQFVGYFS
ncbi:hypothetical protein VNO77_18184 [Canavalia gladiata]|uniref:Uncharacterized protein n=1 Tax=Canavalia gladiata TaxID=3824 RepID=A0AAN9LKD1_CANGL